jgi:mannosyltransferase OCH1-like enzyme
MVLKTLHQVWLQGGEPAALAMAARSVAHAAGWSYSIWSAADVSNLTAESQAIFRALSPRCCHISQQSNVLRYLVLHDQGGLYLDTDVDLRAMPEGLTDAWVASCRGRHGVSGFALAAPANHPSIARIVHKLPDTDLAKHAEAGPALLSKNLDGFNLWPVEAWRDTEGGPSAIYGHHLCSGRAGGTFALPPVAVPA